MSFSTRGLRFRLTASYALFFTLIISFAAIFVQRFLATSLDQQLRDGLEQEWGAMKGYLRIDRGSAKWYNDPGEPEEAATVARLRQVFLLTESSGKVIEESDEFHGLGLDNPKDIRASFRAPPTWTERRSENGNSYLVRAGLIADENAQDRYYAAIGRSMVPNQKLLNQFTLLAAGLVPLMILSGCVMGWIMAGRGLSPVLAVAKTAQRIGGSNLSLRIPARGADDELDFLIETFNEMIERLENSFRQIRQFSTDVSHELRTPVTILRGQLEVALLTAETKEQYRDAIVDSLQDIERMSQIIRALLLLSQAETGQVVLNKTTLDFSEVLSEICEQFQIPAEGAQVTLSVRCPPTCAAELDRIQIERMLSNLLSNAIKFTPPGGKVQVALECEGGTATLIIADTGCGVEPSHLPHIFDRFYRAGNSGGSASPEKGLGLGLSFVAWIVKAHDGTVDVQSAPGQGTTFTVKIPAGEYTTKAFAT